MMIDVYISGEFFHRWNVDDMAGFHIEGASWQENVEARIRLVDMYYEHFMRHTYPFILNKKAEVYVVFESKMNQWEEEQTIDDLESELSNLVRARIK